MKRITCVFLTIMMIITLCVPAPASESALGTLSSKAQHIIQYKQGNNEALLVLRKNYGYMTFIENFKSDPLSLYLFGMTDRFLNTGVEPDKEMYMETLINIIATCDLDRADDVAEQKKMDNLKTFKDYALDVVDMGVNAASVMVDGAPQASDLEEQIKIAISGLSVLETNINNWITAISDLETIIQDYSEYDLFLQTIEENSDGDLSDACHTLRNAMHSALKIKLDTYSDVSEENFENFKEFFFSDLFFESLKLLPEYKSDVGLKYLVDAGDKIVSKAGALKSSWELGKAIGVLVGDAVVGGENLINRVLEMMAIYDISLILQEQVVKTGIDFITNIGTEKEVKLVEEYLSLSNTLIGCRIRGEYCLYSIVAKDAGLLSWFGKDSAEEARAWYNEKAERLIGIQEDLLSYNTTGDIPENAIDNMLPLVNAQVNFFRNKGGEEKHITSCKKEDDFWNTFGSYCNSNLIPKNDTGEVSLQDGEVIITSSKLIDLGHALFEDFDGTIPNTDFYEYGPISYDEDEDAYHFSPASMHDYIYKEQSEPALNDDGTITITYLYEESYWADRDVPGTFAYDVTFRINNYVNESSDNPYYYTIISVEECATLSDEGEQENISFDMTSTVASGKCGDNLTWTLDDEGTLTISGSGNMPWFFPESNAPWYPNRLSIKTIILEDGITSIGDGAFDNCSNLTSIALPNSLTMIGYYAFSHCDSLKSITLPNSLTSIEERAFYECTSLVSITLPEGITSIDQSIFLGCTGLTSIILSDGVTIIWEGAFSGCNSLKSITLPKNLTRIRDQAFEDCNSLTEIYFLGTAPNIDNEAFLHINATAYYPSDDSTWNSDVKQNYGGNITWVEWDIGL